MLLPRQGKSWLSAGLVHSLPATISSTRPCLGPIALEVQSRGDHGDPLIWQAVLRPKLQGCVTRAGNLRSRHPGVIMARLEEVYWLCDHARCTVSTYLQRQRLQLAEGLTLKRIVQAHHELRSRYLAVCEPIFRQLIPRNRRQTLDRRSGTILEPRTKSSARESGIARSTRGHRFTIWAKSGSRRHLDNLTSCAPPLTDLSVQYLSIQPTEGTPVAISIHDSHENA